MPPDIKVEQLNDHFGQYLLILSCRCGHVRECNPKTLADIAGWTALLADVVKRMRCSRCGRKECTARPVALTKPRGWRDPRS